MERDATQVRSTWRTKISIIAPPDKHGNAASRAKTARDRREYPQLLALSHRAGGRETAHHRAHETVSALGVLVVFKSELRTGRRLAEAHGKAATHIVRGERGFILHARAAPGVHADRGEIAGLSFPALGCRNHILRLVSRRIGHGVQLGPGHHPPTRRADIIADRTRRIELHESRQKPSG